jgi:hypothetical protein
MPKINEAVILRRAKALCKQDGKNWDFQFSPLLPPETKFRVLPFLDEAGRSEYLARAREQIADENDGDVLEREAVDNPFLAYACVG